MPVDATASAPRADIRASRNGLVLTGLAVAFPASVLQPALLRAAKAPRGWIVAGDIAAGTPTLAWTPAAWSGGIDVDWRNAQLTPAESRPVALGDLSAKLVASGNRLAGPVVNRGGDIDVRGDIARRDDRRRHGDAGADAAPRRRCRARARARRHRHRRRCRMAGQLAVEAALTT